MLSVCFLVIQWMTSALLQGKSHISSQQVGKMPKYLHTCSYLMTKLEVCLGTKCFTNIFTFVPTSYEIYSYARYTLIIFLRIKLKSVLVETHFFFLNFKAIFNFSHQNCSYMLYRDAIIVYEKTRKFHLQTLWFIYGLNKIQRFIVKLYLGL